MRLYCDTLLQGQDHHEGALSYQTSQVFHKISHVSLKIILLSNKDMNKDQLFLFSCAQ